MRRRDETEKSQASARPEAPPGTKKCLRGGAPPPEGQWQPGPRSGPAQMPRSLGLGGSRTPGFTNSEEIEVNSATAEQTVLRVAL